MTYIEALDFISEIYHLGSKLGLQRIKMLLELMGNPQNKLKIIHVAGTNGKGSVCAMISNILMSAGLCVGVFTSPHLTTYNERYVINNVPISDTDFANQVSVIKKYWDIMFDSSLGAPTVFECLTALAFNYFHDFNVDIVILEVGLGGLLDATNVIESPILSVITSISLDHTEYLGHNIIDIAKQKGGIIKENSNVVLQYQSKEVYNVISNICEKKNSNLFYNNNLLVNILSQDINKTVFNASSDYFNYDSIEIKLLGTHQVYNACSALLAVFVLRSLAYYISDYDIYYGLKNTSWFGRLEIVASNPYIILDGAHNIDGIKKLKSFIEKYFSNTDVTLLFAVLSDKDYTSIVDEIINVVSKIVVTQVNSKRTLNAELLFDLVIKYNKTAYIEKNIKQALLKAISITDCNGVVICCGSLYLIGELKKIFMGE